MYCTFLFSSTGVKLRSLYPSFLPYLSSERSSMMNSSIPHHALVWIPLGCMSQVYISINTPQMLDIVTYLLKHRPEHLFQHCKEEVRVAEVIRVAHLNCLDPPPLSAMTACHVRVFSAIYTNILPRRYFILHVPQILWVLVKWNGILMLQQNRVKSHLSSIIWAGKGQFRW